MKPIGTSIHHSLALLVQIAHVGRQHRRRNNDSRHGVESSMVRSKVQSEDGSVQAALVLVSQSTWQQEYCGAKTRIDMEIKESLKPRKRRSTKVHLHAILPYHQPTPCSIPIPAREATRLTEWAIARPRAGLRSQHRIGRSWSEY